MIDFLKLKKKHQQEQAREEERRKQLKKKLAVKQPRRREKSYRTAEEEEDPGLGRWLLTYSDLITLMMGFFIIMFAVAQVDADKFRMLARSIVGAFAHNGGNATLLTDYRGTGIALGKETPVTADSQFAKIIQEIREYAAKLNLSQSIQVKLESRGLVLNLADTVLFESGRSDLSDRAEHFLDGLAQILLASGKQIRVEGHTDNVPIHTSRYQSNWQLSTDRATNVIMYWIAKYPTAAPRLSAVGYGEYHPIASNATATGRAMNRRIEILLAR